METQKMTFTRSQAYEIALGHDILAELAGKIQRLRIGKTCVVLTNDVVGKFYLQPLVAELRTRGFHPTEVVLPDGEAYKTLDTVQQVLPRLLQAELDRQSPLIALGGGVIGDLGGFTAALYKRGIPVIQMPTSLLAMVDAAIGGKVGVNTPQGKNLVGTFYQPTFVGIDVGFLRTLPLSQMAYGLVEALKHGAIADAAYFKFIAKNRQAIKAKEMALLQRLVRRSIYIKKSFVEKDEMDRDHRACLNFGHTFGHALEVLGEYRRFHHGEAVGLGMLMALAVSRQMGLLSEDYTEGLRELLVDFGLSVDIPREWPAETIMQAILQDKKREKELIRIVLPIALGKVDRIAVPLADLKKHLQTLLS